MKAPTTLATHACVVQYSYRVSSMLATPSFFFSAQLVETGAAYATATADHLLLVHVLPYARLCMQVILRACCAGAPEPLIPITCIILYRNIDVHPNVVSWWLYSNTSWYERESLRSSCRFENEVGAWRVRNGKRIDHVFATRVWDNSLTFDTFRVIYQPPPPSFLRRILRTTDRCKVGTSSQDLTCSEHLVEKFSRQL